MNLIQLNRALRRTLLLPIVALGLLAGSLAWQLLDAERAVTQIQIADTNIERATLVLAYMVDEETGLRAYQTTGKSMFLQPYENASEPLRNNLQKLHDGMLRQHANMDAINNVRSQHTQWVRGIAEPIIASVQAGSETRDSDLNLRSKGSMDSVRQSVRTIIADQTQRRNQAVETWHRELGHTVEAIIGSALVAGLLIGIFAYKQLHNVSAAFQGTLSALRKHAQATYDSEQRLRAILSSLGEAVVLCDLEGRIELMNPAAERLSGSPLSEARGRNFEDIFRLEGEASHQTPESPVVVIRRELRTITSSEAFLLRRPDGTELTVDESGAPVYERTGALAGVVLVLRDSTQQRRTQAALLASEKLAVAGRLAATIAHEIHNPLDSVANLLYLMRDGSTPEEVARFLDMAQGELSRATQISRALLGMYRESRTAVALDIASLLGSVLVLLERRFKDIGVRVEADLAQPAVVSGFPAELRQVFTNLLINAAEASPRGKKVIVTAKASEGVNPTDLTETPQSGTLITIEDRGPGVQPEILRQLFQPFFSTKGEAGTGLGLWVSKGIVEKHGGTIELDSFTGPEEHGTRVSVFLPRGQAEWTLPAAHGDRRSTPAVAEKTGAPSLA